ncbi:MAG: PAS domain S-box protein [Verrucomicrobiota bacterium]|jgi:two-component system, cell cycle sensor histidine kinase and response regulator CckA
MATPLNILIVEDSPSDAELVVAELRRAGFDPRWKRVETEREFLAEINNLPQIILSDYSMPQFTGLRAAKLLQSSGLNIPFILISGTVGEDVAVEAMKHGATDYLLKDRMTRLGVSVEQALEQQRMRDERKRVEASLNLFRTLLDRSNDGIEVIDPKTGRFLDVNVTTCQRLGFTREELLTMRVPDVDVGGVTSESWGRNVEEIRQFGFKIIYGRHQRKDGSTFPVEINVRYVQLDRDYLIAAVRDITERKQAQETLRRSEEKFRKIFENVQDVFYQTDNQGIIIEISPSIERYSGYHREDLIGQPVEGVYFNPEDRDKMLQILREKGEVVDYELRLKTKTGRLVYTSVNAHVFFDSGGKPDGVEGALRDITARKHAEQSQARLATAVEQAAESIVITDTNGAIFYVNPAFEKISGYSRAEVLGQNPRLLKSGQQPAEFYRSMWAQLKQGAVWQGRFINRSKDGRTYEEEATISPVRDATGEVVHYVSVQRDVTREMQLEAQLRQAQKMEAFGQLAGGVAHDFNNILAVIQLQVGLLKSEQNLSLQQLDFADDIEKAAQRAANLTRQLLLFSRQQAMQPHDLNVKGVVANMTRMLQRTLGEHIHLQFKFSEEPMYIHADPGMIDQILLNLTVNARDAMPKGGDIVVETSAIDFDEITAAQISQARPGSFVCLSVTDSGCGIPPEILQRIFEPFFTTKDVGKGTGLGLATVFGIIQQHKGWITVYSKVDQGTTFRIFLPRLTKSSDTNFIQFSAASIRGGTETVLVVEDEPTMRSAMRITLSRLGYHVLEAATGAEALAMWQQHREEIRLLLTDMVMPGGMTGRDLAQQILQQDPKLKVIYASGYAAEIAGQDLLLKAGVSFLAKPFQTQKLAQTIRQCLDQN